MKIIWPLIVAVLTCGCAHEIQSTPEQDVGMRWWNGLTKPQQEAWHYVTGSNSHADAWAVFQRNQKYVEERKP